MMLPCFIDLVRDTLQAHALHKDARLLEWVVLDVTDAFWTLGLCPSERKFFVRNVCGKYWYVRVQQAGAGQPRRTAGVVRFFVLILRLTIEMSDRSELTAETYVDGPGVHGCRCHGAAGARRGHRRLGVVRS